MKNFKKIVEEMWDDLIQYTIVHNCTEDLDYFFNKYPVETQENRLKELYDDILKYKQQHK